MPLTGAAAPEFSIIYTRIIKFTSHICATPVYIMYMYIALVIVYVCNIQAYI